MKLRFDPDQAHQREAIAAVLDVFEGHPFVALPEAVVEGEGVVANRLLLPADVILENAQNVQRRAGLQVDRALGWLGPPGDLAMQGSRRFVNISVEMETGTGKTYAYLRTALQLAQRIGWRKFVVVVPQVAVREGVLKTLHVTQAHFAALFPGLRYRFFAYDGARLSRVRAFADGADVDFMIVTIDAFNKASNLLRRPHDAFGGRVPLDVLRHARPVLVLDEPQNLESELSRQSLAELHPLLALRYSATHRRDYTLVHRLTPAEAHARGLVKRVEVAPTPHSRSDAGAELEEDARARGGARIRRLVELHVQRQARLRARGVKVLSLLFVDRVDAWVGPDPWVKRALHAAFVELRGGDPGAAALPPEAVAAAYFAPRGGRGAPVDSRSGQSAADQAAYALIMRDKERLASLSEPVAFVVSHSALREGWDNPNVFQICALGARHSARRRRQEIGRGLRLSVDAHGERVRDPEVDVLTVIADEDYESFVAGLQSEEGAELSPAERTPAPRRVGERTGRAMPHPSVPASGPVIPGDLIARVVDRLSTARLSKDGSREGMGRRADAGARPNAIDLVIDALRHRPRPTLVSRATVLEILTRLPPGDLAAAPHRAARRVADAIAAVVLGGPPGALPAHQGGVSWRSGR